MLYHVRYTLRLQVEYLLYLILSCVSQLEYHNWYGSVEHAKMNLWTNLQVLPFSRPAKPNSGFAASVDAVSFLSSGNIQKLEANPFLNLSRTSLCDRKRIFDTGSRRWFDGHSMVSLFGSPFSMIGLASPDNLLSARQPSPVHRSDL